MHNPATNIATDFFFAILPIPLLWHIQMNKRTKIALMAVLGLGILLVELPSTRFSEESQLISTSFSACVCAIVRTVEVLTYPENDDFLCEEKIITTKKLSPNANRFQKRGLECYHHLELNRKQRWNYHRIDALSKAPFPHLKPNSSRRDNNPLWPTPKDL